MCVVAALQAFLTYPETCGKSIEEVEELFKPGAPWPWKTKVGHSHLDQVVEQVKEKGGISGGSVTNVEDVEKSP